MQAAKDEAMAAAISRSAASEIASPLHPTDNADDEEEGGTSAMAIN